MSALMNVFYCLKRLRGNEPIRFEWKRRRWILWSAGVLFAAGFACYWIADEIYPFVG